MLDRWQTRSELFMPHELFDILLQSVAGDRENREHGRHALAAGLKTLGFANPDVFWSDLERAARRYLALKAKPVTGREQWTEVCSARIEALNDARRVFGKARFDEILYRLIAPDTQSSFATTYPDPAEELRRDAGGCR